MHRQFLPALCFRGLQLSGLTMRFRLTFLILALLASANVLSQVPVAPVAVPPAPDFGGSVLQLILGLGLVLAMVVGALWLLKQLTQRRGTASSMLKVVAGTAVGPRERVVIVEVGTTWLVLGVAPGRVSALAEVPRQTPAAAEPVAPRRAASADFPPPGA